MAAKIFDYDLKAHLEQLEAHHIKGNDFQPFPLKEVQLDLMKDLLYPCVFLCYSTVVLFLSKMNVQFDLTFAAGEKSFFCYIKFMAWGCETATVRFRPHFSYRAWLGLVWPGMA